MDAFAITPSDTDNLPKPVSAIYAGSGPGSIAAVKPDGGVVVFENVQPGGTIDVDAIRINATGTSVTGLVGMSGDGGMDAFALFDIIADPRKAKAEMDRITSARNALADEAARVAALKAGVAKDGQAADKAMAEARSTLAEAVRQRDAGDRAKADAETTARSAAAALAEREALLLKGEAALQTAAADIASRQETLSKLEAASASLRAVLDDREADLRELAATAEAVKADYEARIAKIVKAAEGG